MKCHICKKEMNLEVDDCLKDLLNEGAIIRLCDECLKNDNLTYGLYEQYLNVQSTLVSIIKKVESLSESDIERCVEKIKMNLIESKQILYYVDDERLITPCPYGTKSFSGHSVAMVGSVRCLGCEHMVKSNNDKNIIECSNSGTIIEYTSVKRINAIIKHGEELKKALSLDEKTDPIKLYRSLRGIEMFQCERNLEELEGNVREGSIINRDIDKLRSLCKYYGIDITKIRLSFDPRGNALTLTEDVDFYMKDFAGFGIIAPDFEE